MRSFYEEGLGRKADGDIVLMLLFTEEHRGWILTESPHTKMPKTLTGRLWKTQRAKVGSIHQARTVMLDKSSTFALLRILNVEQMMLLQMTEEMAQKEGCRDREHYFEVFFNVNKKSYPDFSKTHLEHVLTFPHDTPSNYNPMLFWPEFEVVDRCQGCVRWNTGRFKTGPCIHALGLSTIRHPIWEGIWDEKTDEMIGVRSCSEFKLLDDNRRK